MNPTEQSEKAEEVFQKQLDWLKSHGYTLSDVIEDEDGKEFVWSTPDEAGKPDRLYLNEVVSYPQN